MKSFRAKNTQERKLRARFHDYNSQRRYRKQSTVSWEKYKEITGNGRVKYTKGDSK